MTIILGLGLGLSSSDDQPDAAAAAPFGGLGNLVPETDAPFTFSLGIPGPAAAAPDAAFGAAAFEPTTAGCETPIALL